MLENRALGEYVDLSWSWRELRDKEFHNFTLRQEIIIITMVLWARHAAHMRWKSSAYIVLVGNLKELDDYGDLKLDGKII
jgi:hypothetical protein